MDGEKGNWTVISSQSWIFLPFPEKTYDACSQRRGEGTSSVAFIDVIECHQFEVKIDNH